MDPEPSVNESADAPLFTPEELNWIDQLIMSSQSQSPPLTVSKLSQSSSASHVPASAGPHVLTMAASQSGKCVIGLVHLVTPAISEQLVKGGSSVLTQLNGIGRRHSQPTQTMWADTTLSPSCVCRIGCFHL